MADVLLINPNNRKNMSAAEAIIPPLGLCYIASYLKSHDISVEVLDSFVLNMNAQEVLDYVKKQSPIMVGFTVMTPSIGEVIRLAKRIKEVMPQIKVMVGGPHISALAEETLKSCDAIDIAVRGEGEETALNLVRELKKPFPDLGRVKGISYNNNGIIHNASAPFIEDLDALPFPSRESLPMDRYRTSIKWYNRMPFATMITSRGCPFECVFCDSHTTFGRITRLRSAKNIFDEIKSLIANYGIKEIMFYDDTFTLNKNRTYELCELIIASKLDISWGCLSRVDTVDNPLILKMKKAGCHLICFGIESGSEDMLKRMRKKIDLKRVEDTLTMVRQAKIDSAASFVLGIPGETSQTIEQTIKFAIKINPTYAQFFRVVPFPGTEIYSLYLKQKGLNHIDWSNFTELGNAKNLIELDGLSDDKFELLLKSCYRRFYLRPKKIMELLPKIFSVHKIKGYVNAVRAFVKVTQ
jgi:anaerobic magnesium-protoporphyrin IX monomethyl ester cyclase